VGRIIIRGSGTNKHLKNIEEIAKLKDLQLISKRKVLSAGYKQTSGAPIKGENIDEFIFKKQ
jgi:hypothetical protein